jgi:two-component system cell cycle response regulator DivK
MSYRLLVVEDNPLNSELLCDWLDTEGFDVASATCLTEALAVLEDRPPQAVLLDVQLGTEDGLSLATWIRNDARFRGIPVIAVTAHAMLTDQDRVMQAGCNACVSKPINFGILKTYLRAFLPDVDANC